MLFALTALSGCGQTAKDTAAINAYRAKTESALEEISAAYDRLDALDAEDAADTDGTSAFSSDPPDEVLLKTAASEYQKAQDTLQSAITALRAVGSSA